MSGAFIVLWMEIKCFLSFVKLQLKTSIDFLFHISIFYFNTDISENLFLLKVYGNKS